MYATKVHFTLNKNLKSTFLSYNSYSLTDLAKEYVFVPADQSDTGIHIV